MLIGKAENDQIVLEIHVDDNPINPRSFDNLGKMVCWHKRYDLGDEHNYNSPQEFLEDTNGKIAIMFPLYLYDHSVLDMNTEGFSRCDPQGWDWGQVGWIYVTYEDIEREYGDLTKENLERAARVLLHEVEEYAQFLRGDVYGFALKEKKRCQCCNHVEYEVIDSCFGFYGDDFDKNGMKDSIPEEYHKLLEQVLNNR